MMIQPKGIKIYWWIIDLIVEWLVDSGSAMICLGGGNSNFDRLNVIHRVDIDQPLAD